MAITKTMVDDKIEVVGDYKTIQVRTATVIKEDGVELSRSFHRKCLNPLDEIKNESKEIQAIAKIVWTKEIKDFYKLNVSEKTL